MCAQIEPSNLERNIHIRSYMYVGSRVSIVYSVFNHNTCSVIQPTKSKKYNSQFLRFLIEPLFIVCCCLLLTCFDKNRFVWYDTVVLHAPLGCSDSSIRVFQAHTDCMSKIMLA